MFPRAYISWPIIALVLSACVAPQTQSNTRGSQINAAANTQEGVDRQRNSSSVSLASANTDLTKLLDLPAGTVDGDAFMRDFRFENYLSQNDTNMIMRRMAEIGIEKKRFPNSFERDIARRDIKNAPRDVVADKKKLPDYLVFKTFFDIYRKNYIIRSSSILLEPNLGGFVPREKKGWYPEERRNCNYASGNTRCLHWGAYKTSNYYKDISVSPKLWIDVGFFNQESDWQNYTKKETNNFVKIRATEDEFRKVLGEGWQINRLNEGRAYQGYVLIKIDTQSLKCSYDPRSPSNNLHCKMTSTPVAYYVDDFLKSGTTKYTPSTMDLLKQ